MRQPWLDDGAAPGRDDFSPGSATRPARSVGLALALALLLLAMGRSPQMLDAAFGLDPGPVSDRLLAMAEAWEGVMDRLGISATLARLRLQSD